MSTPINTGSLLSSLPNFGINKNNIFKFSGFVNYKEYTLACETFLKYAEAVGLAGAPDQPAPTNSYISNIPLLPTQTLINNLMIVERKPDGDVEFFIPNPNNLTEFYPLPTNCSCCQTIADSFKLTDVFFDIGLQKCRWKQATCDTPDDIFKIVLNSTGSDGSIFSEDAGEDCNLTIDLDFLFKFDCESLTKLITTQGGIGTCTDVVNLLESLTATAVIDVIDPIGGSGPSYLRTVFSETIFTKIGEGNLYNYLKSNGDFTGFFICGKLLHQQQNDDTCYPLNLYNQNANGSVVNCSTFVNNLIPKIYEQSNLNPNNADDVKTFKSDVSENAFRSEWLNAKIEISDPLVLEQIKNEKIKLSVQISGNCIDSCLYFDNIKLEKNCRRVEKRNIFISKTPGFDLDKIIDNKKSWVEVDDKTRRTFYIAKSDNTGKIRNTDYYLLDSEQIINTKEIDLDVNIASAIETDVWDYIYDNDCLLTGKTITNTGATFPIVVKDRYGNDISLPMVSVPVDCSNSTIGQEFVFELWRDNFDDCQKINQFLSFANQQTECICLEAPTYECTENYSIVKIRAGSTINFFKEFWVTCEKSGETSQNRFYYVEDNSGVVTISGVTGYITENCINEYNEIIDTYIRSGFYVPNILKKDANGNCIDCGCGECNGDADTVDLKELFTLSLDTVDTLEDFKYYATSQLIDAKNRKTMSSYPTLNLLYERYLNSNKYCTNLSSQFTYKTMDEFANLIGNYWVDLVEQVIPSTTIWGATRIYSNSIFDTQKFQYKQCSILFGETNVDLDYPSPTIGVVPCNTVTAVTTTLQGKLSQNTSVLGWENNTSYNRAYIVQLNSGSEFIGSVGIISNKPNNNQTNIINDCVIGVTISGKNPDISLSNGTATANVVGEVQQNDIKYLWDNGATGKTITNLSAGTYSVTVWDKDNEACKAIDMITLIEV